MLDKYPGLMKVYEQTAYKETRSLKFLHHLVALVKPKSVLELGTGKGCSTAFMALAMDYGGMVITVDNYKRLDINSPELVRSNLGGCGILDKVKLVQGDTFDVFNLTKHVFNGAWPEIIFMDSSHKARNLHKEYAALSRGLPSRHVIIVDDALFNDVMEFVLDLLKTGTYPCYLMVPFHQGMAILPNSLDYLDAITAAVIKADGHHL